MTVTEATALKEFEKELRKHKYWMVEYLCNPCELYLLSLTRDFMVYTQCAQKGMLGDITSENRGKFYVHTDTEWIPLTESKYQLLCKVIHNHYIV